MDLNSKQAILDQAHTTFQRYGGDRIIITQQQADNVRAIGSHVDIPSHDEVMPRLWIKTANCSIGVPLSRSQDEEPTILYKPRYKGGSREMHRVPAQMTIGDFRRFLRDGYQYSASSPNQLAQLALAISTYHRLQADDIRVQQEDSGSPSPLHTLRERRQQHLRQASHYDAFAESIWTQQAMPDAAQTFLISKQEGAPDDGSPARG